MHTFSQYLTTLTNPHGLIRRLEGLSLVRDLHGRIVSFLGNSAAIFHLAGQGKEYALRCYLRPLERDLELLYPGRVLREELYLFTSPEAGEWVDVVLCDWVEGESLDLVVRAASKRGDQRCLSTLSDRFDRLAAQLCQDDWAMGDLKPENILVDKHLELHLIDRDAMFIPAWEGMEAIEVGTPAWQHPSRTKADFNRWIDHYSLALLSVQLRALALDPTLLQRHPESEGLLFSAQEITPRHRPSILEEILSCFAQQGAARHYRLGMLLNEPIPPLKRIEELLSYATLEGIPTQDEQLEFYMELGLCGFRSPRGVIIPPLYDHALDFREGYAAVMLGGEHHLINPRGESCWRRTGCNALKSPREGKIRYRDDSGWHEEVMSDLS